MVTRLGPGAEFDRIRSFLEAAPSTGPEVVVGPGDDAAVLTDGVTLTVDMSVEDVHFRRTWLEPREIGYRSAAGAISDLAAMAARPIGVLVSVALGADDAEAFGREAMAGATAAIVDCGGLVLGGDLTRSPGPVVLDVVAVGRATQPVLRSGARPGDEVWVTGDLGGAAAAVEAWLDDRQPPDWARRRYAQPQPRWREALWLGERSLPTAMIDLSDGIAGDAAHIAAASGVRVVVQGEALPVAGPTEAGVIGRDAVPNRAAAMRRAAGGGEDYELCFTAAAGAVEQYLEAFQEAFSTPLTRVGEVEKGSGAVVLDADGAAIPVEGFQHWRRG